MDATVLKTMLHHEHPRMRRSVPSAPLAVVMERVLQPNRWEDAAFRVIDVIPDEGQLRHQPRKLLRRRQTLALAVSGLSHRAVPR
jgi:hypothetical protein